MSEQFGQYPPPPPTQPAPPGPPAPGGYYGAVAYPPSGGAVGKVRSIGASIGLAIITLGIYTYVWTWKTHDEIKRNSGTGVGGPVGFLIYFVVSPVTFFLLASEVRQMVERTGRPSRVRGLTGLWILLALIGPIVWFVKVQGQLNDHWRSLGATR